jgi:tetratricopeptide (TPR) repeat protein
MARRRLNKKVALAGSAVFMILVAGAIALVFHLNRDPEKFITDGDAALQAARQATDEEVKNEKYKSAERNYHQARSLAKTDSLRIRAISKLANLYRELDQWTEAMGCWNTIVRLDDKNVEARFGQLKYLYLMAESGFRGAWQEVASQASEFLAFVEQDPQLSALQTIEFDPFPALSRTSQQEQLGSFLYLVRGRAMLERARSGTAADADELLAGAFEDLKRVQQLQLGNVAVSRYLAVATITQGEIDASHGDLERKDQAVAQAVQILEHAAQLADNDPETYISLLGVKMAVVLQSDMEQLQEQIQALEPEYLALTEKFPNSPKAFHALAGYYRMTVPNLDKAVEAAETAVKLDKDNVAYALRAARLHYSKYSIYNKEDQLEKAVEIAKHALTLPEAQDKPGPREWANRMNKITLFDLLAECYIEQLFEDDGTLTSARKPQILADAEQTVREIEHLFGIGEAPQVMKWRGLLELAKGNKSNAIRKMYAAYEQLKSVDRKDSLLSYRLAKAFSNATELGAVKEFLESALRRTPGEVGIDGKKPEALLDYADVLLILRDFNRALTVVDFFEKKYWPTDRSDILRARTLIGAGQFDDVDKELADRDPDDANTIGLKMALLAARIRQHQRALSQHQIEQISSPLLRQPDESQTDANQPEGSAELIAQQLQAYWSELAQLQLKLLQTDPNLVRQTRLLAVCNNYLLQGQVARVKSLIEKFLQAFPDDTTVLFYKRMLAEPDPTKISEERQEQMEEQVLFGIDDPVQRAISLGKFYHRRNELNKAAAEFTKVIERKDLGHKPAPEKSQTTADPKRVAAGYLFEIALAHKDWQAAEQVAENARLENLDDCQGLFFAARLALAREDYSDAMTQINEALKQRPVFSHAYVLRSNINAALGNDRLAVEDASRAASLNPLDGNIAKGLASALVQRNRKLGEDVSPEQLTETINALHKAIRVNPSDLQLQSFYAEYIGQQRPDEALAIRQRLLKAFPNPENALLLGRMAMRLALAEQSDDKKEALFAIAQSSFEQALTMDPKNQTAIEAQAEYYRLTDQSAKAEELLQQSQDPGLLWAHYYRDGKFDQAKVVLEQLYDSNSKDTRTLKGLLLVAERNADKDAVIRYSEELVAAEQTADNHLLQIRSLLSSGLVNEAGMKLESFKEKFREEPRALLLEAWLAMRQGQLKKALDLANKNLTNRQQSPLAWRVRGQVHFLMTNYDLAIEDFRAGKRLLSEPATRIALAKAYLKADRIEDAITELNNTIQNPQVPSEARYLLEMILARFDRNDELEALYDQTLTKFPNSLQWHNRAAKSAAAARNFDRAERLYAQALRIAVKENDQTKHQQPQPSRISLADYRAALDGYLQTLVLGAGDPKEAAAWKPQKLDQLFALAEKYRDTQLAPTVYLRMAQAKLKLGDDETPRQYCQTAFDRAIDAQEHTSAAVVAQRISSLIGSETALNYCRKRLQTAPESVATNYAMFSLAKASGDYNKAIGFIDRCLAAVSATDPRAINFIVGKTTVLELAYSKTSDNSYLTKAIAEYESLLTKMPNNTVVLNNLAYMLAKNDEKLTRALEYAKKAYQARPNNPGFLDTYAYVLYKNKEYDDADQFAQAALQQFMQNDVSVPADTYEHLALIKEELEDKEKALDYYKQAMKAGADTLSEPAKDAIRQAIMRLGS